MALPKPQNGEDRQDFISRCVLTLITEDVDGFPTRAQRTAVCYAQWGEPLVEKPRKDESLPWWI